MLYNAAAWTGIILSLALGSWWPVVILVPIGVFVLPKVLASLSPIVIVSPAQTRRVRRTNLVLLVLFILLILMYGLSSQS